MSYEHPETECRRGCDWSVPVRSGGSNRDDGSRSNLNSMERYDPISDTWTEMPPMNRSRGAASIAALNNCLYAVGGYDSGQWLNEVERFDPQIGQWTLVAPLNHCRTGIAVTAFKRRGVCYRGL